MSAAVPQVRGELFLARFSYVRETYGADAMPRLFERFYRAEASRNRARGGAGLGLAICRSIVEAHDGEIGARASPLGGLAVTIALPAAP